jgi:hypothetical protein
MSLLKRLYSNSKIHPIEYENVVLKEGKTVYTGHLLGGKKNGQGTYVDYSANVEYKGEWENDQIHGAGTVTNYFTDLSFTGTFIQNEMVFGTMTWANGAIYRGYFEKNEFHGLGALRWPDGSNYEGMFENGRIRGYGTFTDKKGNIDEREF